MKAGDNIPLYVYLADSSGFLTIADTTAFNAAGYDLTITIDGSVQTPAYTVENIDTKGLHKISFVVIEGDYEIVVTVPATYTANPDVWVSFVDSVELSDVYAAVNSGGELSPITQQLGDQGLGNLIDGDSFNTGELTVPLSRLTPYGLTDLTGCTISAAFRQDPSQSPVVISASITDSANRLIKAESVVFPPAMALGATSGDTSATWYLDIQIVHTASTQVITVARYSINVLWQRDET